MIIAQSQTYIQNDTDTECVEISFIISNTDDHMKLRELVSSHADVILVSKNEYKQLSSKSNKFLVKSVN